MMIMAAGVIMTAVIPAIRHAQHTFHTTDRAADTRADRAADDATHRSRRAVTAIGTLFRATDNALRMPGQRGGKQHQKRQG